jgi:uncharacterized protein (DUF1501 family)
MTLARREFLCRMGGIGAAALAMERFGIMNALADTTDYKALVCIFLFGGNDANNMLMPYTDYTSYSNARLASGIAIPKDSLLQVSPPSLPGTVFGLHPSMTGMQELWNMGKLGVVCNVGPLVEPTSRTTYQNGSARVPLNLFSHSDQQNQWQTSVSNNQSTAGWGGRIADKTADLNIVTFPAITSLAGTPIFTSGNVERPLAIAAAPTALNAALQINGFSATQSVRDADPRYIALQNLLLSDTDFTLIRGASRVSLEAVAVEKSLRAAGNPTVAPFPLNPRTTLGNQLEQIAKMISIRNVLGMKRQIFFCSLGGFDTHTGQVTSSTSPTTGTQANLFAQLSGAMRAFYDATVALGVESQVTTFTLSDFSRTFVPNGTLGTDHAWASHHFVSGGALRGSDFYGLPTSNGTIFPTLAAGAGDDTDNGGNARGRFVPSVGVDQFGATLASWFGVSDADLPAVFPNINNFGTRKLSFV